MKKIIVIISVILLSVVALLAYYSHWNAASPSKTCAGCHEISQSVDLWDLSAHRNIACKDCHGTALSEGMHSMKEKAAMLLHHNSKVRHEDVKISEVQRMELLDRCKSCHQTEFARWNSGGHSMNYADVFLNADHNKAEKIYDDCLRCHGMFYDNGTIQNIVEPMDTAGPWKLKDAGLALRPAIPCFACHQIHKTGSVETRKNLGTPASLHYTRIQKTFASFYYRRDGMYFPVLSLMVPEINYRSGLVRISPDPNQRLCIQCHSPNSFNMSGTGDDRTPRGVHEGISCLACHDLHSNSAIASCKNCHPAISNCKLDVEKMNTTYKDQSSKNNIHFVACTDCHPKGRPAKRASQ